MHISRCRMISRISLRARDFLWMAALGVRTEKLRLYRHVVNGVLLITLFSLVPFPWVARSSTSLLAVTKVDGLPPAPSTVSYGALAGKIFRALGAILLSKDVEEPILCRHSKNAFLRVVLLNFSGALCEKL